MNIETFVNEKKTVFLSEYFKYYRGKRLKKSDRVIGEIPLVTAGYQNEGIASYISNASDLFENAITIDMFGNCFWRPYKFACDDNIIVLNHENLNSETAHYFLSAVKKYIGNFHYNNQYRLEDLRKHAMDIPIKNQSIDYQTIRNISGILSKIAELEAELETELETELEVRTKQYEYYRNKLLDFSTGSVGVPRIDKMLAEMCPDGVEHLSLGEIVKILDNLRKPVAKDKRVEGQYPYYGANGIQSYINDYIFDGVFILMGEDGSVVNKDGTPVLNYVSGKIWVNNHAHVLQERNDGPNLKYLYYVLSVTKIDYLVRGTPPKLNQANMRNILLPVPPLEVQNEIVKILDSFSEYTTSISQGLPAEIAARRKQYEYYRNKLLTF